MINAPLPVAENEQQDHAGHQRTVGPSGREVTDLLTRDRSRYIVTAIDPPYWSSE
jgi:hypothetical protein